METISATHCSRVRQVRSMTGLSRKEFAKQSNISINTVQGWEQDKTNFSLESAIRVARAVLNYGICVQPNWVISGEGQSPYFINETTAEGKARLAQPECGDCQ